MSTDPITRVAYFSGEALLTADFQDEQRYHMTMREQLSQGLLTHGILRGLEVEWTHGASQVIVRAGTALDAQGQLIVLTQDTGYAPSQLVDGRQNFLTIGYDAQPDDLVTNSYGQGYKRWVEQPKITCAQDYDPNGTEILLAVIEASGGVIQSIYYYYGRYVRRRVSAVVQSVEFSGAGQPAPMSIGATGPGVLSIEAPQIELNGAVTADSMTASGSFTGTFSGDGTNLKLPPSTNYWNKSGDDLYYTAGSVAIGDVDASDGSLTVRQSDCAPVLATGLISLNDDGTVTGYQTLFKTELQVGQVITYGYIPPQIAIIANVISPTTLEIDRRFPIDLGPSPFATKHGSDDAQVGAGKIIANGNIVTCQGGVFPGGLMAGDSLIIEPSSENAPKMLRVQAVISDTKLQAVNMTPGLPAGAGPKLSAFSVTPSVLVVAGGANPIDPALPPALVAAQNGSGSQIPNSVGINIESGALDGRYALDVQGAIKATRWPAMATDSALMLTVGSTTASPYQGLSVTDNGASVAVPKTVAVNVDRVDPTYALDVNGPFRATSLVVASGGFDIGTVKASSEIDTDKISAYTESGNIEVTSDVTFDKTIKGSEANPLTVAGDLEVKENATIDGALTVAGSVNVTGRISGKLQNPIPGPLNVDGVFGVLDGNNPVLTAGGNKVTVSVDLYAQGSLNIAGALTADAVTVAKHNAQGVHVFDVSDDGDVSMMGSLTVGANGADNFEVSPGGDVAISKGALTVGSSLAIAGDGKVALFGVVQNWTCSGIATNNNPFFENIHAETDGFLMVYIDPNTAGWNTSAQVLINVTAFSGCSYQVGGAAILGPEVGRACASTTVPIQKNSSISFTFNATSNSAGGANITIYWVPFGIGGLVGMHNI